MRSIVGCVGDLLVEIMRQTRDEPLGETGVFLGPFPSGASGIFIDAVARLGIGARFVGTVGNDDFGELIINRFKRDGVDTSHIKRSDDYTTGVAFVTYFADGSRKFIYHLGNAATGQISPEDVKPEYFLNVDYLHVVGSTMFINEQSAGACIKAIDIVKGRGGKVSFDPNFRPELLSVEEVKERFHLVLTKSDIIFPTMDELKILTGETNIKKACTKLLETGFEIVAIKQGKDGSSVYTKEEEFHVPAFRVEEIDPTGAGDCYCAGFLAGLIKGMDVKHTALFANAVGALAVTKKGPMEGAPKEEKVNELLDRSSP
jgi:sugar/nucleoside kinase (ribokinase family)